MTDVWSILKTLLFSNLMISQSILNSLIYYPQASTPPTFTGSIAQSVLRVLVNLSFIISKVGGLSSTTSVVELKRCFYTAVDCFSIEGSKCNDYVIELCQSIRGKSLSVLNLGYFVEMISEEMSKTDPHLLQARLSMILLLTEQLVPVLTEDVLQDHVVPLCLPYVYHTRPLLYLDWD